MILHYDFESYVFISIFVLAVVGIVVAIVEAARA